MGGYTSELRKAGWQRKRLEILLRDQWCCVSCLNGPDETPNIMLQVHHKSYPERGKQIWEVDDDQLVTLCDDCHERHHRGEDIPMERPDPVPKLHAGASVLLPWVLRAGGLTEALRRDEEAATLDAPEATHGLGK